MTPRNDLLLLAGKVVTIILQAAMAIGAAALAITLAAYTVFAAQIVEAVARDSDVALSDLPFGATAGLLAILLVILAALFVFFGKLRAIIATVGEGDPFAPANAERLASMAWLLLAAQVLLWPAMLCAGILAEALRDKVELGVDGGDGVSLTGVLMVLVLFILARVFRHGTMMREDLEGTV